MACMDFEDSPERQLDQVRESLNQRTRQLCAVMSTIERLDSEDQNIASYPRFMDSMVEQHGHDFAAELDKWWEKHKEADKANSERLRREYEAKKLEQERDELQERINRLRNFHD